MQIPILFELDLLLILYLVITILNYFGNNIGYLEENSEEVQEFN